MRFSRIQVSNVVSRVSGSLTRLEIDRWTKGPETRSEAEDIHYDAH